MAEQKLELEFLEWYFASLNRVAQSATEGSSRTESEAKLLLLDCEITHINRFISFVIAFWSEDMRSKIGLQHDALLGAYRQAFAAKDRKKHKSFSQLMEIGQNRFVPKYTSLEKFWMGLMCKSLGRVMRAWRKRFPDTYRQDKLAFLKECQHFFCLYLEERNPLLPSGKRQAPRRAVLRMLAAIDKEHTKLV